MGKTREFNEETETSWQYHLTWAGNIIGYLKAYGSPFKEDYLSELGELQHVLNTLKEIIEGGYWERPMTNSERAERNIISVEEEATLPDDDR